MRFLRAVILKLDCESEPFNQDLRDWRKNLAGTPKIALKPVTFGGPRF